MSIQILINHYHESAEIVGRLLRSIDEQIGVQNGSFDVLLYSDGSDVPLSDYFLSQFSFPVTRKVLEHRGVCATRNALLDDATAEWVMFCDADDCFHSSLGLYRLFKAANDLSVDIIGSPYEKETLSDNSFIYTSMQRDTIRVHGKIFRRQYLVDNNIRFPDELPYSGDMYFLWQAYNLKQNYAWMRESFYLWKYNPDSVTRKDPFARLKTYPLMLRNYELLAENLLERERTDLFDILAASTICMVYLNATNEDFMDGPQDYQASAMSAIVSFVQRFGDTAASLPRDILQAHYESALRLHQEGANSKGFDGLLDWIREFQT